MIGELLATLPEPGTLTWDIRCYLLPRLVRLKPLAPGQTLDPSLERWLRVHADRLGSVLALDLPQAYQVAVCLTCLAQEGEPTPAHSTKSGAPAEPATAIAAGMPRGRRATDAVAS